MSILRTISTAAWLLLALPAAFFHTTPVQAAVVEQDVISRLDTALAWHYPQDQPGAAIIVVKDGKTIFRKAYGLADVAAHVPMAPAMALRVGSVTKQFTASAILLLADQGKLALADDIRTYLPDFPTGGKTITLEHLLTHTSGIVSYTGMPGFFARDGEDISVEAMIERFKDQPKLFEAGQRYAYGNSGYFLLGAIIEKVSGRPYADFMAENIFIPLGMQDTAIEGRERSAVRHVPGYRRIDGEFVPGRVISMSQAYAAGALVSTVDDLARWDAAISSGKLLRASTWEKAFTPYTLSDGSVTKYGYGWDIGLFFGQKIISHGGNVSGFNAGVLRIPAHGIYIAVLNNAEAGHDAEMVAAQAAAIITTPAKP